LIKPESGNMLILKEIYFQSPFIDSLRTLAFY